MRVCGCGELTRVRFVSGHNRRDPGSGEQHFNWKGDQASYAGVHRRLAHEREKTGNCSWCSARGVTTEWAYTGDDPLKFSTNLDEYTELCLSCHRRYDSPERKLDEPS